MRGQISTPQVRFLIIDDQWFGLGGPYLSVTQRNKAENFLKGRNISVRFCATALSGILECQNQSYVPDVVIFDALLPEEAAEQITLSLRNRQLWCRAGSSIISALRRAHPNSFLHNKMRLYCISADVPDHAHGKRSSEYPLTWKGGFPDVVADPDVILINPTLLAHTSHHVADDDIEGSIINGIRATETSLGERYHQDYFDNIRFIVELAGSTDRGDCE